MSEETTAEIKMVIVSKNDHHYIVNQETIEILHEIGGSHQDAIDLYGTEVPFLEDTDLNVDEVYIGVVQELLKQLEGLLNEIETK